MSPLSPFERFLASSQITLHAKLFDRMPAGDLMRLSKTSTVLREVMEIYQQKRWNIDRFLGCWFWDSGTFRATLARTGAVISGSQALRFMDRLGPSPRSDLDIITRVGGVLALTRYVESHGYTRVERPRNPNEDYPLIADVLSMTTSNNFCVGGGTDGIIDIFDFERPTSGDISRFSPVLKVQIIAVAQNPVHHLIYTYHSSKPPSTTKVQRSDPYHLPFVEL
ncbi:hypothetical protein DFP72DRAFT_821264 [Ephemerocybe angulata]|uniref:Uncharacterized protein n=1 Tax=Ephemerocybe angulata TaxID=980116 RepID=A0A8H6LXM8_9AGAR|nr:hypothetical protein DFP72DRAFT_821264 [Tulosesus angulatus]